MLGLTVLAHSKEVIFYLIIAPIVIIAGVVVIVARNLFAAIKIAPQLIDSPHWGVLFHQVARFEKACPRLERPVHKIV